MAHLVDGILRPHGLLGLLGLPRPGLEDWLSLHPNDHQDQHRRDTLPQLLHDCAGSRHTRRGRRHGLCQQISYEKVSQANIGPFFFSKDFRIAPEYSLARSYQISENVVVTMGLILPLDISNAVLYLVSRAMESAFRSQAMLSSVRLTAWVELSFMVIVPISDHIPWYCFRSSSYNYPCRC